MTANTAFDQIVQAAWQEFQRTTPKTAAYRADERIYTRSDVRYLADLMLKYAGMPRRKGERDIQNTSDVVESFEEDQPNERAYSTRKLLRMITTAPYTSLAERFRPFAYLPTTDEIYNPWNYTGELAYDLGHTLLQLL